MKTEETDIVIIGGGPVGLMCAYLGQLSGLKTIVLDKSAEPLKVGRADALNARTLQLLEVAGLFEELYPHGKPCNTSSVWSKGKFISRQSSWWDQLEGCLHKHFLMLGQSFVEQLLDKKLREANSKVQRLSEVVNVKVEKNKCYTTLSDGSIIHSRYIIGADGSRSLVRELTKVAFEIVRPQIIWAVIDGIIETDYIKVPEIIVFQAETSDVAWIPREGNIDRFYVRMDTHDFTFEEAMNKINRALQPHTLKFKEVVWSSKFSVKESVAEKFSINNRIFLVGDACHIHSVNGGQGLNTGLADAFNLMWKLTRVIKDHSPIELLDTYEKERKPVALSVVESSGELVRSTKYSETGTHAQDYVKIVEKRAGNITGMGIRYEKEGLNGSRFFDFEVTHGSQKKRIYTLLDYTKFTLAVFGELPKNLKLPTSVNLLHISSVKCDGYWSVSEHYKEQAILIRPDSYIHSTSTLDNTQSLIEEIP